MLMDLHCTVSYSQVIRELDYDPIACLGYMVQGVHDRHNLLTFIILTFLFLYYYLTCMSECTEVFQWDPALNALVREGFERIDSKKYKHILYLVRITPRR